MKNILLPLAFLILALLCQDQKPFKNEVTIGWYGGYFFDNNETSYKFQAPSHFPTITYNYLFKKKTSIGILYGKQQFGYLKMEYDWLNSKNKILARSIRRFAINVGYDILTKPFVLRASAGVMYNKGVKLKHLYAYDHGIWVEKYQEYIKYNDLGTSFALTIRHPILWRFYGEVSVDYLQMFSGVDKQQLMPSYRIGFKF